jgi:hypothetical protein
MFLLQVLLQWLAFAFSLETGKAFADNHEVPVETVEETVPQEQTTDRSSGSTTEQEVKQETTDPVEQAEETEETKETSEDGTDGTEEVITEEAPTEESKDVTPEVEEENLSLVPGDFFYFVKVMTEKIRLAFTFDDYKEAQLLAEFAAERIHEANTLLAEGKIEEAEELLKEAIATQDLAGETLPDSVGTESSEETEGTDQVSADLVESKLAYNIESLLVALEKIGNPKGQEAIIKNIEESFEKLQKKMGKLDKLEAKFVEKMSEIEEKAERGQISTKEADRENAKLEERSKETQKIEEVEARDVEEINNEEAKEMAEA